MIDQVDDGLRTWVQTVMPDVDVHFEAPSATPPTRGVTLYLLNLRSRPRARGTGPPPLQLTLCYLVTVWSTDLGEAHRLLGDLVFAAMSNSDVEVELEPIKGSDWAAFGTPPRPAFLLLVPLRKAVSAPAAKFVRGPLVVQTTDLATLYGQVLGPGDVPIPEALVELPNLNVSQRTDPKGYFRFATIPAEPSSAVLRVTAKGSVFNVPVERPTSPNEPVLVHLELQGN